MRFSGVMMERMRKMVRGRTRSATRADEGEGDGQRSGGCVFELFGDLGLGFGDIVDVHARSDPHPFRGSSWSS
jgi:hypothetical protein